jgi:PAS domain S-box-containing protein
LTRRHESILDSVGDGIWGMDMEGRLTFINRSGAEMLGYSPQELLGQNMHDLIHHSRADGTPYPVEGSSPACRRRRVLAQGWKVVAG